MGSKIDLAQMLIPDCVDEAIFSLLTAIDDGSISVAFRTSGGALIDLTESGRGELAGWYVGSDGWRGAYSKERFNDDAADVLK
jgi:hypothetical protein